MTARAKKLQPASHQKRKTLTQLDFIEGIEKYDNEINSTNESRLLQTLLSEVDYIQSARNLANPIERAKKFAQTYLFENRLIPHDVLLTLIFQHLNSLGLSNAQLRMQQEWDHNLEPPSNRSYSQLSLLLERGLKKSDHFWEIILPSAHGPTTSKSAKGLLDQEISKVIGANTASDEDIFPLDKEKPGDEKFLILENNLPSGASLNQLIYYCTIPREDSKHTSVARDLCMNISTFASPKLFFKKLCDRYHQILDEEKNIQDSEKDKNLASRAACINLIKIWFNFVADDLEPQILDKIYEFQDKELSKDRLFSNMVLKTKSVSNMISLRQIEAKAPPVELGNIQGLFTGKFDIFDLPAVEFARQLTVFSSTMYYNVKNEEFLDAAWDTARLKYRAPNLIGLGNHFSVLPSWVTYQIFSEKSKEKRWEKTLYILTVADILLKMNNYLDGTVIILAFCDKLYDYYDYKSKSLRESENIFAKYQEICEDPSKKVIIDMQDDAMLNQKLPVVPFIPKMLPSIASFIQTAKDYLDDDHTPPNIAATNQDKHHSPPTSSTLDSNSNNPLQSFAETGIRPHSENFKHPPNLTITNTDEISKETPDTPHTPQRVPNPRVCLQAPSTPQPLRSSPSQTFTLPKANPQTTKHQLINFKKCMRISKLIEDFRKYAKYKYAFIPIDQIQNMIAEIPNYDDNLLNALCDEVLKDEEIR